LLLRFRLLLLLLHTQKSSIHNQNSTPTTPSLPPQTKPKQKNKHKTKQEFQATRNCVACCGRDGLLKFLEAQQAALEVCEKALADFVESKRRAFPRFYFVSTADLLDMLSNGDAPRKVMPHMSKCFQAIDRLRLDGDGGAAGGGGGGANAAAAADAVTTTTTSSSKRPVGLGMVSSVGEEYVGFAKPLPLEGKVEAYMNDVVDAMRGALKSVLRASVAAYPGKPRDQWLFDWPCQIALVASQIFWCQEVEQAIADAAGGGSGGSGGGGKAPDPHALRKYNEFQVAQLTRLIEVTRTALSRSDRQKVMNMVTIDAHGRDVVAALADAGVARGDCFEWMSQLRLYWDAALGDCRCVVFCWVGLLLGKFFWLRAVCFCVTKQHPKQTTTTKPASASATRRSPTATSTSATGRASWSRR
jgi:dynein heavy chain